MRVVSCTITQHNVLNSRLKLGPLDLETSVLTMKPPIDECKNAMGTLNPDSTS